MSDSEIEVVENNATKVPEICEQPKNLPWVEKYRPAGLCDLVSHEEIVRTLKKFIKDRQLPHLLFYGPPGTGKTSTILACAKELYKPAHIGSMVLELNASDDRGIGIVRGRILNFASTRTIFSSGFKLVILDEADAMTHDAQNALRRIIEKYTENVRFCIICNYLTKIIPALQSRCMRFRFGPLQNDQILPRLDYVVKEEGVNITEDGKQALITLSQGDMRKVLNILQSTAMSFAVVNEDNVYTCVGHPLKSDISNLVLWLLNDPILAAFKKTKELKVAKGLALIDILEEVHRYIHQIKFPKKITSTLLVKLSEIECRLAGGANEDVQLGALLAAFFQVREHVGEHAD
ncbi:replication factor C subunit 5 [Anabrus simplex]|uniref:replication factor C subunit 5 n=1 Tax=Anabrus simplex TaxID=316456 RepID=UPI0034DD98E0